MSRHAPLSTRRHLAVVVFALCVATAVPGAVAIETVSGAVADAGTDGNGVFESDSTISAANAPAEGNVTLVVAADESGERLLEVPVSDGDEIVLSYTHSVEKTAVKDVYTVDGTDLRMVRMVFSSYGAGLPSEAAVTRTEDGFVVSVDRSFERLHVVPGSIAGHELVVGDRRYDLVERSDGSPVVVFVADRPPRACNPSTHPSSGGDGR